MKENGDPAYWGEIPQSEMQAVNGLAQEQGWRQALEILLRPRYPAIYRYVTSPSRSQWRFLLPLSPDSAVLDIGAGWGTLSFQLAEVCRQVVSLELITDRLEFIRIRRDQSDHEGVQPLQGDALHLPFARTSFDLVVMNGVLEWVGCFDLQGDPRDVQLRTLKRIRELLKPGGYLYVGIENRIGFTAFLGAEDHSGFAYTSLMPRVVANLYVRARSRLREHRQEAYRTVRTAQSYRTYTYSWRGYQRLLKEAGFQTPVIYMALPGYNEPLHLVSIDDPGSFRYLLQTSVQPRRRVTRLLRSLAVKTYFLNLQKCFAPEFCIFVRR